MYRWHVAFPVEYYFRGLGVVVLLYASLLAVMQLIAILQPHTGLLVLCTYGVVFVSSVLQSRHLTLIQVQDSLTNRIADSLQMQQVITEPIELTLI